MPSLNSEAALCYVLVNNQSDENVPLTVQGLVVMLRGLPEFGPAPISARARNVLGSLSSSVRIILLDSCTDSAQSNVARYEAR